MKERRKFMKISCDIIRDLLPLYNDGASSKESVSLIDEHLKECPECMSELGKLKEDTPVRMLKLEEKKIIGAYRRSALKKALLLGLCLVVFPLINVFYIGRFYEVSFIKAYLATALIMLNSVYLPAVIKNNRKTVIAVSSIAAPVGMFFALTFNLYNKYYDEVILLLSIPSIIYLGLSLAFIPLKIRTDYESPWRYKKAALRLGAMETLILLTASITESMDRIDNNFSGIGFKLLVYVMPFMLFLWAVCLLIRFIKTNSYIKASAYTLITGLFVSLIPAVEYFADRVYEQWDRLNYKYCFWQADLFNGGKDYLIANISLIILLISAAAAAALFAKGKWGNRKIGEKAEEKND